jgi:threonine/homoserine/homoserine lactone efflux protein
MWRANSDTTDVAPVEGRRRLMWKRGSGFLLGIANPKAYIAFASLLASQTLVEHDLQVDALLKWIICVVVAIVVDIVWLFVGVKLQRAALRPQTERILNFILAATILVAAIFTLL